MIATVGIRARFATELTTMGTTRPTRTPNPPRTARGRLLVVSDDVGVRRVISAILQAAGFSVWKACDGVAGVEKYRSHWPDLAFVDVEMPSKDGLEVIREIRAEFPAARLISMSGAATVKGVDTLRAARDAGALGFLPKPITVDGVLATVGIGLHVPSDAFVDLGACVPM